MKTFPLIVTSLIFINPIISFSKPKLRVGHAQKPEQASAELESIRKNTKDLENWKKRKDTVIKGILKGAKLTELPERKPLNPRYVKKQTHEDYTTENVAIESSPGHFVTGTLYRPTKFKGS